ncbi:unnamed protein product [Arctogadus glacialis]
MTTNQLSTIILICIVIGGGVSAPLLSSRSSREETDEMVQLFDPGLFKEHVGLFDDYGVRPGADWLQHDFAHLDDQQRHLEEDYF